MFLNKLVIQAKIEIRYDIPKTGLQRHVSLSLVSMLLRKIELDKEISAQSKVMRGESSTNSKTMMSFQARMVKQKAEIKKLDQKIRTLLSEIEQGGPQRAKTKDSLTSLTPPRKASDHKPPGRRGITDSQASGALSFPFTFSQESTAIVQERVPDDQQNQGETQSKAR